jgi:uncharacterized protein (TIGR02246 family)
MRRSLLLASVLVIGLAGPTIAAQLSEQEARQAVEKNLQAWVAGGAKKDAAAIAALYTEDAMRVTPQGALYGRSAIEKDFVEGLKVFSDIALKLDQVKVVNDDTMLTTGTWSGTLQGPSGPMHVGGFWGTTNVRDGGTWKTRLDVYNMTPPPPEK